MDRFATEKYATHIPATFVFEFIWRYKMENEIWKDIVGYEGKYQISNKGNVKSVARKRTCRVNGGTIAEMKVPEKILKKWKRSCYFLVDLWNGSKRDTRSVHILVYEAFVGKIKKGMMIHHKDENKLNNDVENLKCYPVKPTTGCITVESHLGIKVLKCHQKFIRKCGQLGD